MKLRDFLEEWNLTSLKINLKVLDMEFKPEDHDRDAAWDLYIELLTRITTQPLCDGHGDEKTALESVHALFGITRETIKRHTRKCAEFTKIAIVVLNQIIRPFTAKWHARSVAGAFADPSECKEFRLELVQLQEKLRNYTKALAAMAGVEDLTELEKAEPNEQAAEA